MVVPRPLFLPVFLFPVVPRLLSRLTGLTMRHDRGILASCLAVHRVVVLPDGRFPSVTQFVLLGAICFQGFFVCFTVVTFFIFVILSQALTSFLTITLASVFNTTILTETFQLAFAFAV